jgi:hypothetical protein
MQRAPGTTARGLRGVTLIMVAAILSILAAMATGFYTLMLMRTKSAVRYADAVRAELAARAGVDFAIAHIREQAYRRTEDASAPWFMTDYARGAARTISFPDSELLRNGVDDDKDNQVDNLEEARVDPLLMRPFSAALANSADADLRRDGGSDRFVLNVSDAASRININATDNLAVLLDNLCRVIGPPLVAAHVNAILPRCWGATKWGGPEGGLIFDNPLNVDDKPEALDLYYRLYDAGGALVWSTYGDPVNGRPTLSPGNVTALYGDGYAIAGYRARNGRFGQLEEIKHALTYVERNGNGTPDHPLEMLEIEVKYAAIRDAITVDSWVDTSTVCVGKFEWVAEKSARCFNRAIDRDKSWIPDNLAGDPLNRRGSLRGCYIAIIAGHGAGQVRRIRTNGVDWIELDTFVGPTGQEEGFTIPPGPISSYMIFPPENAKLVDGNGNDLPYTYPDKPPPPGALCFPKTDANGNFIPATNADGSSKIDYSLRPLCFHRAPVNVNTASDKVLAALFLGINAQQGHHLSIGTEADLEGTRGAWTMDDTKRLEPYLLTARGLKRVPVVAGKPVLDRAWGTDSLDPAQVKPPSAPYDVSYINNHDTLGRPAWVVRSSRAGPCSMNEAHELAYRAIMARQHDPAFPFLNPWTGEPVNSRISTFNDARNGVVFTTPSVNRGPIRSWDDFYFRVVKPWDDRRTVDGWSDVNGNKVVDGWVDKNANQAVDAGEVDTYRIAARARLIMAHFNPNTDILKFNPNIEWINRWGRNFTIMEPVHIYPDTNPLPNTVAPLYVQYGFWKPGNPPRPIKHWSGRYDWCEAVLMDYDSEMMGAYITRNFRYKSDEMIDKTDLNRGTTEFCFDSAGIYEIQSLGQVCKRGEMLAERKLQCLVRVYDVWRESTQRQFVQGIIETGPGISSIGPPGTSHSGQIARDSRNGAGGYATVQRLSLNTLPEPLVPIKHRMEKYQYHVNGARSVNREVVDTIPRDAFGNQRRNPYDTTAQAIDVPDVVANKIQPAGYDGQIVLATNTLQFDPGDDDKDSFLASFDGDLDTGTCLGNGREQAKMPGTASHDGYKYRVVDTCSVLGVLNDTLWDNDPMASNVPNTYMWGVKPSTQNYGDVSIEGAAPGSTASVVGQCLRALNPSYYWENASLRQGDLRADGVWLSAPGVGGNDATLKYAIGWCDERGVSHPNSQEEDTLPPGQYPQAGKPHPNSSYFHRANFDIMQSFKGSQGDPNGDGRDGEGFLVTMWAKTAWRQDDNRPHEFFNAGNPGHYLSGRGFIFSKGGRYNYAKYGDGGGFSGCTRRKNDLYFGMEGEHRDILDRDNVVQLHGGSNRVKYGARGVPAAPAHPESPAYRIQPFRWCYLGVRLNYAQRTLSQPGQLGHWYRGGGNNPQLRELVNYLNRPFISTQTQPEDAVYDWGGGDSESFWARAPYAAALRNTYLYQCNTLINDSYFARAPDIGRTFHVSGKPTFTQGPYGRGGVANKWNPVIDNKGNGALGGTRVVDCGKGADYGGRTAQDVRWDWADHPENPVNDATAVNRVPNTIKVFSINNLNFGEIMDTTPDFNTRETDPGNTKSAWMYRHMPEDGTYAVIDELKISKREKTMQQNRAIRQQDRVTGAGGGGGVRGGEMRTSRYYLPPACEKAANCPTFTSQPMLQSLKGTALAGDEKVCVARVTWTVFTPRFINERKYIDAAPKFRRHEYMYLGDYQGGNWVSPAAQTEIRDVPYHGPFDWLRYNSDNFNNDDVSVDNNGVKNRLYSVNRPRPEDYAGQSHASKGVEVELGWLEEQGGKAIWHALTPCTVAQYDGAGKLTVTDACDKITFTNPDTVNRIGAVDAPARIESSKLRYRVRFRYPVDQLVDTGAGKPDDRGGRATDVLQTYLLDTPVFDDITVTYFTKPRILAYREIQE